MLHSGLHLEQKLHHIFLSTIHSHQHQSGLYETMLFVLFLFVIIFQGSFSLILLFSVVDGLPIHPYQSIWLCWSRRLFLDIFQWHLFTPRCRPTRFIFEVSTYFPTASFARLLFSITSMQSCVPSSWTPTSTLSTSGQNCKSTPHQINNNSIFHFNSGIANFCNIIISLRISFFQLPLSPSTF